MRVSEQSWLLLPYTGQNEGVFHCPSATRARADQVAAARTGRWTLYGMNLWKDDDPLYRGKFPKWSEAFAQRSGDFPILFCIDIMGRSKRRS